MKSNLKKKLRNGLMLGLSLLLIACATSQGKSVVPNYDSAFLEKVALEFEARTYGDATAKAVTDWSVMISE